MRVLPSQITAYIDSAFPWVCEHKAGRSQATEAGALQTVVDLLDELGAEFLPYGDNYVKLAAAKSEIKSELGAWEGRHPRGASDALGRVKGYDLHPVQLIRQVMASIPDQIVPESVAGLEFIRDEAVRIELQADIASVEALLHAGVEGRNGDCWECYGGASPAHAS